MAQRSVGKTSWFTVVLIIAAVVLWIFEQQRGTGKTDSSPPRQVEKKTEKTAPVAKPSAANRKTTADHERAGSYEVYRKCTLAEYRNNDGDSFKARLPDGRIAEFRLYYVDTPESAFKRYAGGDSNHERIRQQAAELGGITPEQAVETGRKGKAFTLGLLGNEPFTLFTNWDSPYNDERYHAFVEVRQVGKPRWLHELLVERGLVRMKTKPADLPDGTPVSKHRDHLRDLERKAKQAGTGVWGM
jgi:endonuclease YncB( thermonuclease family)